MKDIIVIIKKELARFFGDKRMVFTTLLMPGLHSASVRRFSSPSCAAVARLSSVSE